MWRPTRLVGPTERSAGLLVGRTHLSGMAVSLVGGDPGVPISHSATPWNGVVLGRSWSNPILISRRVCT
jgi:hypothetical protein